MILYCINTSLEDIKKSYFRYIGHSSTPRELWDNEVVTAVVFETSERIFYATINWIQQENESFYINGRIIQREIPISFWGLYNPKTLKAKLFTLHLN